MTERDWMECTDPQQMLCWLRDHGKPSERKLRLFACSCWRMGLDAPVDERSLTAITMAELFADGLITESQRGVNAMAAVSAATELMDYNATAAWQILAYEAFSAALAMCETDVLDWDSENGKPRFQPLLLREIFGNPFRPVVIDPAWLAWNDGTVFRIAAAIYAERAFDRVAILADALEGSGCSDAELLSHLRGPGPHAAGCWALDAILGKK